MDAKFTVPLITEELCPSYFGTNCIDALCHLESIMEKVFEVIGKRIDESSEKINEIRKRADTARRKVDCIKGRTKATQVFSSSQYPGKECYESNDCLFDMSKPEICVPLRENLQDKNTEYSKELQDKLIFFHVKEQRIRINPYKMSSKPEGWGAIPDNISSIVSLQLHNSSINLYDSYRIVDPFYGFMPHTNQFGSSSSQNLIEDAPISLKKEDYVGVSSKDEFHYLPDLSDLPELDLPAELPSLPGIAYDLLYDEDIGPGIAPSFVLPDLPPERDEKFSDDADSFVVSNSVPTLEKKEKIPQPVVSSDNPPLPPPNPPPPPPPPPISVSPKSASIVEIPGEVLSDTRSNLMKAIQQAGGAKKAKLRKISASEPKDKKPSVQPAVPKGDLMSDLFSKLAQRRKGISGTQSKKDNETKDPAKPITTMEKMSMLIPALPKAVESDSENKPSEDEWE